MLVMAPEWPSKLATLDGSFRSHTLISRVLRACAEDETVRMELRARESRGTVGFRHLGQDTTDADIREGPVLQANHNG
jgi:hypothetical protein